jgi:hypothetical protein
MPYLWTKALDHIQNLYNISAMIDPRYGDCEVGGKLLLWYDKLALRAEK